MWRFGLVLGVLAGCDSPSPAMRNARVVHVAVADSLFALRRLGDEVEVQRLSAEVMPDRHSTGIKALAAIRFLTGCDVRKGSLRGDQAVMRAELDCDGDKAGFQQGWSAATLDCEAGETWRIEGLGMDYTAVDCFILP